MRTRMTIMGLVVGVVVAGLALGFVTVLVLGPGRRRDAPGRARRAWSCWRTSSGSDPAPFDGAPIPVRTLMAMPGDDLLPARRRTDHARGDDRGAAERDLAVAGADRVRPRRVVQLRPHRQRRKAECGPGSCRNSRICTTAIGSRWRRAWARPSDGCTLLDSCSAAANATRGASVCTRTETARPGW